MNRKKLSIRFLLSFFILFFAVLSHAQQKDFSAAPLIHINSGDLQGVTNKKVTSFKGIPYAAPPVGKYRWRSPQPVEAWEGVRDASEFGAECAQAGFGRGNNSIAEGSSEDCLYLNIWKPAKAKQNEDLPVMVWIHGGAFKFGSGAQPSFEGTQFAKQGVVLITINYRLDRLGFFAFPALSKEHPEEPKGNYAYMDQIAALEWVNQNISAFGGDPNNVTIFGQSAGGVSVHSLLTIPAASDLFHKAISESGGGRDGVLTGRSIDKDSADVYYPVSAETIGVNFARKHDIYGTDAAALDSLRALSAEEIIDAGQETDGEGGSRIYSGPILDGKLVIETAESAYKVNKQKHVPLLIGSNSGEVPAGFVNADSKEQLFSKFGDLKEIAMAAYDPQDTTNLEKLLTMVNTDVVWAEPARFTADAFTTAGDPVYVYRFSYVSEALKHRMPNGAPHGAEIPYVFNNLKSSTNRVNTKDENVAEMMNTYWVNFAKSGDPNGGDLPSWPVFDPEKNSILEFRRDGSVKGENDRNKARLDVIEEAVQSEKKLVSEGK